MKFEIKSKNEMLPFAIGTSKDEVLKHFSNYEQRLSKRGDSTVPNSKKIQIYY